MNSVVRSQIQRHNCMVVIDRLFELTPGRFDFAARRFDADRLSGWGNLNSNPLVGNHRHLSRCPFQFLGMRRLSKTGRANSAGVPIDEITPRFDGGGMIRLATDFPDSKHLALLLNCPWSPEKSIRRAKLNQIRFRLGTSI